MKKQTPMQMKKTAKSDPQPKMDKKPGRKPSAMERYANERNASLKATVVPGMAPYDPQTDLHHMQKAAEVHKDPARRRAAKQAAMHKIKALTNVLK